MLISIIVVFSIKNIITTKLENWQPFNQRVIKSHSMVNLDW